jgi:ATP-dependent Clp protease ATP-binding subunit ClpA
MASTQKSELVILDPDSKGARAREFEEQLKARIVGQDRAVRSVASLYQVFQAGLSSANRPIGTMLLLGPTGSGKTRVVEAVAEALFGDSNAVTKIDCAEFQHSHEIAKLVGSPPGYLGHRETSPLLSQENLDRFRTDRDPFSIVLFDEIEKASDALWQLLLGILDKGVLTLGDNRRVDFTQTIIFMTSNLGAKEMTELVTGSIGFSPARASQMNEGNLDQQICRTALEAARRKFSPEFMNRIDKVVVFHSLGRRELDRILDLELSSVQRRVEQSSRARFTFSLTDEARQFLLDEGADQRYGARHLKRSIERFLVHPLANLLSTGQVRNDDFVVVELDESSHRLAFFAERAAASLAQAVQIGTDRIAA